jgi:tetratricopeptide (TPR) repeat protein
MTDVRLPARAVLGLFTVAGAGVLALVLTFPSTRSLAQMFESDGQIDVATQYEREWIREHPGDYDARLHTADLLMMTVHPEQALVELESMTRDWPRDPDVLRRLVDVEDSLLLVDETLPHLERLRALVPSDTRILHRLADHYRWKGMTAPLLVTLRDLTRQENAPEERAELIDTLLSSQQYDTIIAWLSPNVDDAPDPVELRLALYEAYVREHRLDEATEQLRRVLALAPERVEYLRDIAEHLVERGMFDDAVALYRQRIDSDPRHARSFQLELNELYDSHADDLVQAGNLAEAVKIYRQRIDKAPTDVSLRLDLAELYGPRSTAVAIAELKALLRVAPSAADAWAALGERYTWQNDFANAIKSYLEADRLSPADRAIKRALAQSFAFAERIPEAIAQYQKLIAAADDDVDKEALIELYLDADNGAPALALAERLRSPARRRYFVGLTAVAAEDYERALPELTAYVEQDGSDLRAWRALLRCATALDAADLALRALRQVQALERRDAKKKREP